MRLTRGITVVAALSAVTLASGCGNSSSGGGDATRNESAKTVNLTIATNAIAGGKNDQEATWISDYVIPGFTKMMKAKGITAHVKYQPSGVDDEKYKAKLSLDLKTRGGADVMSLDGIWVGEFAQAGYIQPLDKVVGPSVSKWDGWAQIPDAVKANTSFDNKLYGVPTGTDGRVLFYNKKLFKQAGLPEDWQPKSWADILDAGKALKKVPGIAPLQINAGTAMGEATTMQGALPLLVGTGTEIYQDGKWQGATKQIKDVLTFYKDVYSGGLGDKSYQQGAKGRDESFAAFAKNKIGVLIEGDYFWRSVVNPDNGVAPMATRDSDVGYALMPSQTPGSGVKGQDFVSMSGGAGYFLNPNTKYPQQAWELIKFMNSPEAIKAGIAGQPRITARTDVNKDVLGNDPMLALVSEKVLPITTYRPGLAVYSQVAVALQQATADIVSGKSVDEAAAAYQKAVEKAVGGADHVSSGS
ncbi:MAG: extracellular solute-binding protein [Actinomycetes bacterium]